jgi:hypothetical protein
MEPASAHAPVAFATDGVAAGPEGARAGGAVSGRKGLEANGALGHGGARDDPRQRREFAAIALRCKSEVCASYSLVALGLQAFRSNRAAAAATHAPREGARGKDAEAASAGAPSAPSVRTQGAR